MKKMLPMHLSTELVCWLFFGLVHGAAFATLVVVHGRLGGLLPWWVAWLPSLIAAIVAAILMVRAIRLLLPSIRPGRFAVGGPEQLAWGLHFFLRRVLWWPPVIQIVMYSPLLRWLAFRALGAEVHYGSMISSDAVITEGPLLVVDCGALVGSACRVTTHTISGKEFRMGRIVLRRGAVLSTHVCLSPDVEVGEGTVLSYGVLVASDVTFGKGVFVSKLAQIGSGCVIGDGAVIETGARVPNDTVIPAGGRWVHPPELRPLGHLVEGRRSEAEDAAGVPVE